MTLNEKISEPSWLKIRFDEICKNVSERIDDPKQAGTDYYVGLEHLDPDDLKIKRHGTPNDVYATKLRFKAGNILFGKRRFYQRKLAVADRNGICSAHMMVLEPIEGNIMKDFLPIFMQSEDFYERALMISEGSLSPTIKWKNLAKQEFWIPTLEEQENVVKVTFRIDENILKTQLLIEKINTYKKSQLEQLLKKGMGHTKFKKVKSHFGGYEEIPIEWEIKTFADLFVFLKTGTNPREDLGEEGDVQYIHYGDIHAKWNMILDCKVEEIPRINESKVKGLSLLKDGDLIIVDASEDYEGCGACVLLKNVEDRKIVSGLHTMALRTIDENVSSDFKKYLTSIKFVRKQIIAYATGISVYGLSKNNLKKIRIPLPKIEEQQKIANALDQLYYKMRELNRHLERLMIMKKSFLASKLSRITTQTEKKLIVQ